jgi:SHS2 domain-containing protein
MAAVPDALRYELMEHTADAMVRVRGRTLAEILINAAFAMFDLQYSLDRVEASEERKVEASAPDREMLLVRLLTALLSLSEAEEIVFKEFDVVATHDPMTGGPGDRFRARCVARGERFDPARHERRIHVKAVTYHMLQVDEERGEAVVVFDK